MNGCVAIYPTPQSLEDKINEYFDFLDSENEHRRGKKKPPTMTGLARYLGFTSRSQFVNYKNKENPLFEDIIAQARMRIEEFYEEELITTKGNASGLIFALKNNARWEDNIKQTITGDSDQPLVFTWDPMAKDVLDESSVQQIESGIQALPPAGDDIIESTVEIV